MKRLSILAISLVILVSCGGKVSKPPQKPTLFPPSFTGMVHYNGDLKNTASSESKETRLNGGAIVVSTGSPINAVYYTPAQLPVLSIALKVSNNGVTTLLESAGVLYAKISGTTGVEARIPSDTTGDEWKVYHYENETGNWVVSTAPSIYKSNNKTYFNFAVTSDGLWTVARTVQETCVVKGEIVLPAKRKSEKMKVCVFVHSPDSGGFDWVIANSDGRFQASVKKDEKLNIYALSDTSIPLAVFSADVNTKSEFPKIGAGESTADIELTPMALSSEGYKVLKNYLNKQKQN